MGIVYTGHEQALRYLVRIASIASGRALVAILVVLCELGKVTFVEFTLLVVSDVVCCCASIGWFVRVKSTVLVNKLPG
jgi:hypothetical protein